MKMYKCNNVFTLFFSRSPKVSAVNLAYDYQETPNDYDDLPPLVIMHGLMGSSSNWATISKVLANTDRKVPLARKYRSRKIPVVNTGILIPPREILLIFLFLNLELLEVTNFIIIILSKCPMHYWVAKTCKNQRQMIKCHIAYKVYYCVHSNRFD